MSAASFRYPLRPYARSSKATRARRVCATSTDTSKPGAQGDRQAGDGEATAPLKVEAGALHEWLGPPRFSELTEQRLKRPGIAVGLAWTPSGGDVLLIETTLMPGKGMVRVTGNLRQVMKESVEIALSYVRSRSEELGIPQAVLEQHNLHVHFPAGAVPKDGPSAGITIATALISLLTGRRARSRIAMSGELTLRVRCSRSAVAEKVVAARRTETVP